MREATVEQVSLWWAGLLGVRPDRVFRQVTVAPHGRLGDYPGVFAVTRDGVGHVSAPPDLVPIVSTAVSDRTGELMSSAWWRQVLGDGWAVVGPSVHHYLDDPAGLPGSTAVAATEEDIQPLRAAVSAEEWQEAVFEDDPSHWFVLRTPDDEVAAAANLSEWAGRPADLGVLTRPDLRGARLGAQVASAAARTAIEACGVVRWCARRDNPPSRRLAMSLGFTPWCDQIAVKPLS